MAEINTARLSLCLVLISGSQLPYRRPLAPLVKKIAERINLGDFRTNLDQLVKIVPPVTVNEN